MPRSQSLRLGEFRAIFRLVGECRELGSDFLSWHRHLLQHMARLTGGQLGFGGEVVLSAADGLVRPVRLADVGWTDSAQRATWLQYADVQYQSDPLVRGILHRGTTLGTFRRIQMVDNRTWYRSTVFNDHFKRQSIDDWIMSTAPLPSGNHYHNLFTWRAAKSGLFGERDRNFVRVLHQELQPHLGDALARASDPCPSELSPRLLEVLACLLEGDSEKQVAARLTLSPFTVHEYVKQVYRHFGANSRAELMAYFLRRTRAVWWHPPP